jgi:hypothetical protein
MDQRCPHCDQLILPDDTVCWQCGRALVEARRTATAREGWQATSRELQLSPLRFYGSLTLLLVLAALLLTAFLGRQPRLQAAITDLPAGWVWIREDNHDFTLFLPETWELLSPTGENQQESMDLLVESTPELRASLLPLGALDREMHTTFYATGPLQDQAGTRGLILVARSRALNQLSPSELQSVATASAADLNVTMQEARQVEHFDKSHVFLDVLVETDAGPLRCQQQFHPGALEILIVTACAPQEARYQETITAILSSFQRLSP